MTPTNPPAANPHPGRYRARWIMVLGTLGLLVVAVTLWRYTALAEWAAPQRLSMWIGRFRNEPWAPLAIIGIFIVGGLVALPITLLLGATALVLPPLAAFAVSMIGALANAGVTHFRCRLHRSRWSTWRPVRSGYRPGTS